MFICTAACTSNAYFKRSRMVRRRTGHWLGVGFWEGVHPKRHKLMKYCADFITRINYEWFEVASLHTPRKQVNVKDKP